MAATPTIQLNGRSDWTLMTAVHVTTGRCLWGARKSAWPVSCSDGPEVSRRAS